MKLYHAPHTCSLSPLIVLNETGLPFEVATVDLRTKRSAQSEDLRAVNPKGQVPTLLLEDGQILTEGVVIVQYLADRVPERALAPAPGSFERIRLQEWLNYLATDLHTRFGAFWAPTATEAHKEALRERIRGDLAFIDKELSGRPHVLGERYTVADAYLFTILSWTSRWPWQIDISPFRALTAFQRRIAERPAVQAALQQDAVAA